MAADFAESLRRLRLLVPCVALVSTSLAAQSPTSPDSALFARVRALTDAGDASRARVLVDSALAAAPAGSPAYAEGLYWRATLAVGADAAETDYRRIAVEYGASPRAADALVRLAQLELLRGRHAQARQHVTQLLAAHHDPSAQARGHYWRARTELDAGDATAACDALSRAFTVAPAGGELAAQVTALRARMPRCVLRVVPDTVYSATPRRDSAAPGTIAGSAAPAASAARLPFTVQVAAYDRRPDAEEFARRLTSLGIDARVSGTARPFRVRVGRYATRAEAAAALRELKQRRFDGFVTDAEPVQ